MATNWPLTGNALARFTRLQDDLKLYGDFLFVGAPDDITFLWQLIRDVSGGALAPELDDVANRSHYWMLRLISFLGAQIGPTPTEQTGLQWGPDPTRISLANDSFDIGDAFNQTQFESLEFSNLVTIDDEGSGNRFVLNSFGQSISFSFPELTTVIASNIDGSGGETTSFSAPKLKTVSGDFELYENPISFLDLSSLETVGGGFDVADDILITSLELPELISVGGFSYFGSNCPNLVSASVSKLISCGGFEASQSPNLVSLSIPFLTTSTGGVSFDDNASLTAVDLSSLVSATGLSFRNDPSLAELSFPSLTTIAGGGSIAADNAVLTSLSMPELTNVDGNFFGLYSLNLSEFPLDSLVSVGGVFYIFGWPNIESLSYPLLQTAQILLWSGNPSLTSVSLPAFTTAIGDLQISGNSSLVSVSLPVYLPTNGTSIDLDSCALDAASVNHILARAVANPAYVSGSIFLDGGTNAAPTGQGIIDKATLQGRGVTVTTN